MTKFSTTASVLFDSNILVIAQVVNHRHFEVAKTLVSAVLNGERSGVIAHQNLLEFFATITNPKFVSPLSGKEATQLIATYRRSRFEIVIPTTETINLWLVWQQTLPKLKIGQTIYDRYLAATALTNRITTILTENTKDFQDIPGISAINPFV
jgi:predicted nucleic acid-binding protein